MAAMQILRKISLSIDKLNGGIGAVIRWLVLLMILLGAYNAVGRYLNQFTDAVLTTNAIYEAQWYLFSIIFLGGAAYGVDRDVHVRVDIMYAKLSDKGRAWIDMVGTIVFMLPFCIMMLWVSWPAVRNSWAIREVSPDPGGLPRYPIKTLILVSFVLIVLQGISQIIKQIEILRGHVPPEGVKDTPDEPDVRHGEGV
jgi:TRAP-type mannitol/chloroaromatic compound transport system permease small subunit